MILGVPLPEFSVSTSGATPIKPWILIHSAMLVIVSLWGCTRIYLAVPSVTDLFAGFGDELPALSRLVFVGVSAYIAVFLFVMSVWTTAIYLPIFRMGDVVA